MRLSNELVVLGGVNQLILFAYLGGLKIASLVRVDVFHMQFSYEVML